MKSTLSNTLMLAGTLLFTKCHAYVVDLFDDVDCTGAVATRNVFDSTCAPTGGFQSLKITTYGGGGQQLAAWSNNDCAGVTNLLANADSEFGLPLNTCFNAVSTAGGLGGSNALSSFNMEFLCTAPIS